MRKKYLFTVTAKRGKYSNKVIKTKKPIRIEIPISVKIPNRRKLLKFTAKFDGIPTKKEMLAATKNIMSSIKSVTALRCYCVKMCKVTVDGKVVGHVCCKQECIV